MRAPRFVVTVATVAVVGLVAVAGLAGCRADPAVAAYVGEVQITEAEVDEVLAASTETLQAELSDEVARVAEVDDRELRNLLRLAGADEDEISALGGDREATMAAYRERLDQSLADRLVEVRNNVVQLRVMTELATAYAGSRDWEVPDPLLAVAATEAGMDRDHPFVAVLGGFYAAMQTLEAQATPVPPSEEDQREIYDQMVNRGMSGVSFEEAQPALGAEALGAPVALRNLLREALTETEVEVNPRYQPVYELPVTLQGTEFHLRIPLTDPAVVDAG